MDWVTVHCRIRACFCTFLCTLRRTWICGRSLFCVVLLLLGPCTWKPGRGVPGCRGGPCPFCFVCFGWDFCRNGPVFRFTFSPAQWAPPQLNGPVQRLVFDWDILLTGPYWPLGSRRKKNVTRLKCVQQCTQDMGAAEVIDVQCRIAGNAGGTANSASLHIRTATFDDEKWNIITLMCSHYVNYYTLFAPSCGSVGDFTDIQQDAEGNLAITSEMQCYNFSVRRLNGDFYAHVYPLTPSFIGKYIPRELFCFRDSHLMLLQYILINLPTAKEPIWVISEVPTYWLEYDGIMCLDEAHRWKSTATIEYLRTHGLHSVPNSIKAIIGDLVYNGTRSRASNDPPPGLWWMIRRGDVRWSPQFTRFYEAASIFWIWSLPPRFSMIIASFFALPGTVPCPAEALRLRSWSVPGCGGDGAVVVRRQVFNTSEGVEFAGFAGLPWTSLVPRRAEGRSRNTVPAHSETSVKPWWNCRFLTVPIGNLRLETCFLKRCACP